MVEKHSDLEAAEAGVISRSEGSFGFHTRALATALVKMKVDPKTVQGMRYEDSNCM